MKQAGILTIHTAHNYGAVLQAYALKKVVNDMGCNCKFINYQSPAQISQYSILNTESFDLKALIKFSQNCFHIKQLKIRRALFNKFINTYLDGSDKRLKTIEEVQKTAAGLDAIIVGSDQVWNVNLKDVRYDYLLDFPKHERRISYAASIGNDLRSIQENSERIIPLIRGFDHISVRENDTTELLKKYDIHSETVLDPTLLLERDEWIRLSALVEQREPYILYYSLACKKHTQAVAKNLASQMGLKVISPVLNPRQIGSGFQNEIACGPEQFLGLLENAAFVCTDSFHGTVFSILFEKPFVAVFDLKDGKLVRENRKASLLEWFGLEKHMVTKETVLNVMDYMATDYSKVYEKKNVIKLASLDFLKNSLKGV